MCFFFIPEIKVQRQVREQLIVVSDWLPFEVRDGASELFNFWVLLLAVVSESEMSLNELETRRGNPVVKVEAVTEVFEVQFVCRNEVILLICDGLQGHIDFLGGIPSDQLWMDIVEFKLVAIAVGINGVAVVSQVEGDFNSIAVDCELIISEVDVRTSHLQVGNHPFPLLVYRWEKLEIFLQLFYER